jgi:hypothetical protein
MATFRPPNTSLLRVVPARLAGRSDSCYTAAADGGAILFEHRDEHLQA